ncbi:hypothetical protein [Lederbergia panacisoli]|uniref:hypothetical protein n=1 Tax=Lederbergia panacisoli TaxID=1255251 RepID=UPI00214BCDCB|nr:hypothetical protein [Lederbergia panacisoli]MCR2821734.1 hypothetical protein [Lederbergia panacisoli]
MEDMTIIQLYDVQIRTFDRASSVSMSSAIHHGNHVFNHRCEGFGEQSGDGNLKDHTISVVDDSDFIDLFVTMI